MQHNLPIAIIGAGPIGLAVVAHLLEAAGWQAPNPDALPTGDAMIDDYLLAVCLPLHALCVPGPPASRPPDTPSEAQEPAPTAPALRTMLRGRVFWGLALWFTAYVAAQSALIFQFVPLLSTWGVETAAILTSVALIGPMQVAGRVVLMCFSTRLATREIGMAVLVLLPTALLALLLLP